MSGHRANDKKFGRKVFRYHPRSDEHSKMICRLVLEDLFAACPLLAEHARTRQVVGGINAPCTFSSGKSKTLDLAIGLPGGECKPESAEEEPTLLTGAIGRLRFSCEAKQCMTEHGKTQPRIFDELSSSHEIVHHGQPDAIATGIVVLNIADSFASPLRQTSGKGPLVVTKHRQPAVTENMVNHLRGLVSREAVGNVGFDAFAIIVINCDNVGPCTIHTGAPAPQPGDPDHYDSYVERVSRFYTERFS
jgi:hypothetical protein